MLKVLTCNGWVFQDTVGKCLTFCESTLNKPADLNKLTYGSFFKGERIKKDRERRKIDR